MLLNNLKNKNKKRRKIVGRGDSSGLGRTCGRGEKGQKSRSGSTIRPHFEGGQMPLFRKLPYARGFKSVNKKYYTIVNLRDIEKAFDTTEEINHKTLLEKKVINKVAKNGVKILSLGDVSKAFKINVEAYSKSAIEKVKKAGGECILQKDV